MEFIEVINKRHMHVSCYSYTGYKHNAVWDLIFKFCIIIVILYAILLGWNCFV